MWVIFKNKVNPTAIIINDDYHIGSGPDILLF